MVQPSYSNNAHDRGDTDNDANARSIDVEQLLDGLFHTLHKFWLQGRRIANLIMSELGGNEIVQGATTWCIQHPDIAICILAAGLVFLLPLLIIFGFGIAALALTFTGILVLEGTLLTVVLMIFLACLGGLAIAVAVLSVIAYFGFSQIYDFFGMERHRDLLIRYMQQTGTTRNAESPRDTN